MPEPGEKHVYDMVSEARVKQVYYMVSAREKLIYHIVYEAREIQVCDMVSEAKSNRSMIWYLKQDRNMWMISI